MCRCIDVIPHESIVHCRLFEVRDPDVPPKKITADDIHAAPMFTVFSGPADDNGIGDGWDMFEIDGGCVPDKEVEEEANRQGIMVAQPVDGGWVTPEWDSDAMEPGSPCADDVYAACAYLNTGGRLVKLPDEIGSKYYRLYPVIHVRRKHGRDDEKSAEGDLEEAL